WAEWLYFNARSADGLRRFYLTFMTGAPDAAGVRAAYVRLQLNEAGATRNFSASGTIADRDVLARAPDLDIAGNSVRVGDNGAYPFVLALQGESGAAKAVGSQLHGGLTLTPAAGRSIPPATIRGARGWLSGYVVPVLSGSFAGSLEAGGETISIGGGAGSHDHNLGYSGGGRGGRRRGASRGLSAIHATG